MQICSIAWIKVLNIIYKENTSQSLYTNTAFTSGRRAQNASSEWNGQKSKVIVNLWQMHATVVVIETNVCIYMKAL